MPQKQLDTPVSRAGTVNGQEVIGFSFNTEAGIIYIVYNEMDTPTTPLIESVPLPAITGQEYTDFIARLNKLAPGASAALMQTCLEYCPGAGTIA